MDDKTRMTHITGIAAPLLIDNLDTDQIMPKQFLRIITREGLDKGVLFDLRFDPDGRPKPDFVLNRAEYKNANILIGGPNFGCGSSREHAVWGLQQLGVGAVIAPSFGEIFFSNALNNRLLLIVLEPEKIALLLQDLAIDKRLDIDLEKMEIRCASHVFGFVLGARHKKMIVEGLDMVGATMQLLPQIEAFEQTYHAAFPWGKVLFSEAPQEASA
ncbi:3-isopropylmalate/(R)-2-methylmalate dehydratase small subunit [Collimonas sp. OK607]|uniref:3-isopropylmalate dehydratase small subunit n=1 Tax=Collimonas sp. OK607 TaxID=1798194 RepID=UPI0008E59CFA|nr:3-isopropylmalate dehydratase small subunit [Collimonas sp. OK607]SFB14329.1 3-isopropylmalate/(R)-2-methylmalate dehydratase small subunit [Collimonas sp. OK607]